MCAAEPVLDAEAAAELRTGGGQWDVLDPRLNPYEVYETTLANLDPWLESRGKPRDVDEVLEWATEPLATAEIVALLGDDEPRVRSALAVRARPTAAGADFYWRAR